MNGTIQLAGLALCLAVLAGCGETARSPADAAPGAGAPVPGVQPSAVAPPPLGAKNPLRDVYFGDLHVHTSWSTDAYAGGNRVGPADAYRFARGEAVAVAGGVTLQLDTPLDFLALTDHAEGFDAIGACTWPDHPLYDNPACRNMRDPQGGNQTDYLKTAFARGVARPAARSPELCADEGACLDAARSTWQRVQAVANEFNDPGRFTALIGYEFSALLPAFGMLHRNVIFRGSEVIPHAVSSADVTGQADLFSQLDAACEPPCRLLTIPHNTNYSWGLTFSRSDEDGSAYTAEDLDRRTRIERLAEVTQQKGSSECQVGIGASDEDCNFGNLFPACAPGQDESCARPGSFVRNALLDGLALADEGEPNIFRLGMIGATDTHNSDPGYTSSERPSRYARAAGNAEGVQRVFESVHPVAGPMRRMSAGGLAAVWAESNTRADIFDALYRREAFATSGSRLRLRFFAGDLPADPAGRDDLLATAYARGVPMGGILRGVAAPRFWVAAQQDPAGPSLDRVQVIKGWMEGGEPRQRVRDVACSGGRVPGEDGRCPATSAGVDTATCTATVGTAASELSTLFQDPDYDPDQRAFYYVRVLENPSCRWTTWLAVSAGIAPPDDVPATVQQRGWSSPIWVDPVE